MRLEQIPLIVGVFVAIVGLGMLLDAQLPDGVVPSGTAEARRSLGLGFSRWPRR